ncbi:hypothetical protein QUC31_008491 [Theobroma cacao]|uniref:2-keto-3-deoxy-L-rhamnonate aldolase n=1 Tax=Theobroma cacao TaxID=3641 RepID=A0AB32VFR3_THECC|nr:PREDICTED: 2-keto-3-deoxy-L-rhamnonate aldolase [Theobroma cacao]WRX18530.1 HpcH/HpaI aldolase/citrate lyase domain - like 1 [Theobroma cacao]
MATLTYTAAAAASPKLSLRNPLSFISSKSLSFPSSKPSISLLKPLNSTKFPTLSPLKCSPNPSPSPSTSSLKSRLRNGETLYGIFLLSFSPTLAEIAALSGYDFVVIDMEHGPGGIHESLQILRTLSPTNTPAIIRLPEFSAAWAKKALDLGPQGIMFPMIDSPKDAKKAVSYCRFPPDGIRGSAHTVVRASNYGINEGYLSNYMEDLLIMCQVETVDAVKKVEEIAAVDGVDCVQMGPLDLSASLGYLWDPGHKNVREMLRTAERGVLKSDPGDGGAFLAGFAMPHDPPVELGRRGYHMVSGAVDFALFRNAALADVKSFKNSVTVGSDDDGEEDKDGDEKYWSE